MVSYLATILRHIQTRCDDDFIDRLNYYYTGLLLIIFAVLVSAKQYVGYPIQCWIPAHFTEAMEQYTENYCWVQNTWWLPLSEHIPKQYYERDESQLVYYQWVPFILAFEALLFYAPCFCWRMLNWQTGLNIDDLVQMARDSRLLVDIKARTRAISSVAYYLEDALSVHSGLREVSKKKGMKGLRCNGPCNRDVYVTSLYLTMKLGYCINIVLQYICLDFFLGNNEPFFGPYLLYSLIHGTKGYQWKASGLFPRVTLCDFEVKVMGNLHRHTVQCVLMINMFNEKIFLFLWFWFAILLILTIGSIFYWVFELLWQKRRKKFVSKFLRIGEARFDDIESSLMTEFTNGYLRTDGVFILRLISRHAGDIILTEVLACLWYGYRDSMFMSETERRIHRTGSLQDNAFNTATDYVPLTISSQQKNAPLANQNQQTAQFQKDTSSHTKRVGENAWALPGGRVFRKQMFAPMPIYKQHKAVRNENKKGQYFT